MVERFQASQAVALPKGRFQKGMKRLPGAGRSKGSINRNNRLIKDAITGAGEKLGMLEPIYRYRDETIRTKRRGKKDLIKVVRIKTDEVIGWKPTGAGGTEGYLIWLGCNHPQAYAQLMARVLPLQINAKVERTETVISKFESIDPSRMTLEERMAAMREMIGLTEVRPEPVKQLTGPIEDGEFTEIPGEAAE